MKAPGLNRIKPSEPGELEHHRYCLHRRDNRISRAFILVTARDSSLSDGMLIIAVGIVVMAILEGEKRIMSRLGQAPY